MNWYKKAKGLPIELSDIKALVQKIMSGNRDWTPEELQLQQNYPEIIEKMLEDAI